MTRRDPNEHALGDFTADTRVVTLAVMAAPIGALSTLVASPWCD